jgi:hypothetical protein
MQRPATTTSSILPTEVHHVRSPSIYENVDLDLADQVGQWFEGLENGPFRDLPGYHGSMTLVDRDNARLVGIGFYASAGHAKRPAR